MTEKLIATTEVWHEDRCFRVDTYERTVLPSGVACKFTETLAYEYDGSPEDGYGPKIAGAIGPSNSLFTHNRTVRRLFETGFAD